MSAQAHTKLPAPIDHATFTVQPLPLLSDNYAYIITDKASSKVALVDPADGDAVLHHLKEHDMSDNVTTILTTHKHWDHSGGNEQIASALRVEVVGGANDGVPACTRRVKSGDNLTIGTGTRVAVYDAPCHTSGHVLYHVTGADAGTGVLFTGDTLFVAGCGKFFEGAPDEMNKNLNVTIGALPPQTTTYCGHEYTVGNLEFASWAEPSNKDVASKLQWAQQRRQESLHTIGTTVEEEKRINPFMRLTSPEIVERVRAWIKGDAKDPAAVMGALREAKNQNAHKQNAKI